MKLNFLTITAMLLIFFPVTVLCINNVTGKNYSVNQHGSSQYQIGNMRGKGKHLSSNGEKLILTDDPKSSVIWRKTNLNDDWFYLDLIDFPSSSCRLRATSYLGANLTTSDLEGSNDDVQWKILDANGDPVYDSSAMVRFDVASEAKLISVGNGDPKQMQSFQADSCLTYHGRCVAILRPTGKPGAVVVKARADNLLQGVCTVGIVEMVQN